MAKALRVLFDLNVVLDVLQRREPFFEASAQVLALAERGIIEGLVTAHSITTLFYLYTKARSASEARIAITELLQFLSVATVDQKTIEQALALPYKDFEDAVQMMAALHAKADYVMTHNIKDFKMGPLPVIQPTELLALLSD
jgi:predicted nucleic acid-binding protein